MNISASVSTIMSTDLITLLGKDPVGKAKTVFEEHNIHHVPVLAYNRIIGVLSKIDLMHFLRGTIRGKGDELLEEARLRSWKVEEIMSDRVITLDKKASIADALEIFKRNDIHCIPIVNEDKLVGILTPHDIILRIAEEGKQAMNGKPKAVTKQ